MGGNIIMLHEDEPFVVNDHSYYGTDSVEEIAKSFFLRKVFEPSSIRFALHYKYSDDFINRVIRKVRDLEINYNLAEFEEKLSVQEKETPDIEVKHIGILEVPEGKNVDDLPVSYFVDLAKKKGLSKIIRALNNLQVWNKNDNKKLSKWAGDMIDKLNNKLVKEENIININEDAESVTKLTIIESNTSSPTDLARYFLDNDYSDEEVWDELDDDGYDDNFIQNVIDCMNDLYEEQNTLTDFDEPYVHIW